MLCVILSAILFGLLYGQTLIQDWRRSLERENLPLADAETVPPETVPEYFGEDIVFSAEYVESEDVMPYALFTPSSAAESESVPLILFLHGKGEYGGGGYSFMRAGLPLVMNNWNLDGFHAYIICPHMSGKWDTGYWCQDATADQIRDLLDKFIAEHPVDTDKIILTGFSSGGIGAMYMALALPEYFSKLVVLSGLPLEGYDISEITIPTLGYAESSLSMASFMRREFASVFGEDHVRVYDVEHYLLPRAAFGDDADYNRRSDLVEWMLCMP
jgi:pimeloyl-ACP methyl ester carboxylesterase